MGAVRDFVIKHYLHFNAAALVDAAKGWEAHLAQPADGAKAFEALAGRGRRRAARLDPRFDRPPPITRS